MVKKIALEEHFLSPGFEDYWQTTVATSPDMYRQAVARLSDFGGMRLEVMDRGCIALGARDLGARRADRATPRPRCARRAVNDFPPPKSKRRTAIPASPISPCRTPAAADELERAGRPRFLGAMINGHTSGVHGPSRSIRSERARRWAR
jgi:2,3-dihydroxybenzoate decarboxylase